MAGGIRAQHRTVHGHVQCAFLVRPYPTHAEHLRGPLVPLHADHRRPGQFGEEACAGTIHHARCTDLR